MLSIHNIWQLQEQNLILFETIVHWGISSSFVLIASGSISATTLFRRCKFILFTQYKTFNNYHWHRSPKLKLNYRIHTRYCYQLCSLWTYIYLRKYFIYLKGGGELRIVLYTYLFPLTPLKENNQQYTWKLKSLILYWLLTHWITAAQWNIENDKIRHF